MRAADAIDARDAACRLYGVQAQCIAKALERGIADRFVERHVAAKEVFGVDQAQNEVCIGDGRVLSAAAIAGGSWIRASAFRADLEKAEIIDMGDTAAAGTDLDQVDRRHCHRQAAAFAETVTPVDLEQAGDQGRAVLDQTGLCSGASHIEGHQPVDAEQVRIVAGGERAGGRAAFDHPHGVSASGFGADDAA